MAKRAKIFKCDSEADMCTQFMALAETLGWECYPETCNFDILAVHRESGYQCGIEAKQTLNWDVLCQVVDRFRDPVTKGPDFLAVLVPDGGAPGLTAIATRLGVTVMRMRGSPIRRRGKLVNTARIEYSEFPAISPMLPKSLKDIRHFEWNGLQEDFQEMCPAKRCTLPDYKPRVLAGAPSPLRLTPWKLKAIKLAILLSRRGVVTAATFKALKLSMSRWTQGGWLDRGDIRGEWVAGDYLPDFRAQHPEVFAECEADVETWGADLLKPAPGESMGALL